MEQGVGVDILQMNEKYLYNMLHLFTTTYQNCPHLEHYFWRGFFTNQLVVIVGTISYYFYNKYVVERI
jgi:hypothetical protein